MLSRGYCNNICQRADMILIQHCKKCIISHIKPASIYVYEIKTGIKIRFLFGYNINSIVFSTFLAKMTKIKE